MWRPAFPHAERCPAYLADWGRRFWQGSTDHRGTPGAPGRVVTLLPAPGELCWGVVYRVEPERRSEVLQHLDQRESGGFERLELEVRFADEARATRAAIVYVAGEGTPNYLGPASLGSIVAQVRASHGPSGANVEYVLRLAESLRGLGAEDPHVFEVAEQLAAHLQRG